MTAIASGRWSSAPAPMPSASGARPASVASVVIRIGRTRMRARLDQRLLERRAPVAQRLGLLEQQDAVLDHQARPAARSPSATRR